MGENQAKNQKPTFISSTLEMRPRESLRARRPQQHPPATPLGRPLAKAPPQRRRPCRRGRRHSPRAPGTVRDVAWASRPHEREVAATLAGGLLLKGESHEEVLDSGFGGFAIADARVRLDLRHRRLAGHLCTSRNFRSKCCPALSATAYLWAIQSEPALMCARNSLASPPSYYQGRDRFHGGHRRHFHGNRGAGGRR
jgi:hypothetical protein